MKIGMKNKISLLLLIVFSIWTLGLSIYSVELMHDKIISAAQEKLKSDLALGKALINERFPGDWNTKDGKLYKGNSLMNNNFDIVDEIGKLTGDTVTIFQGDTRIATNVKKNGERAVGTQVAPNVAQATLKEGHTYVGVADVVGTWNQTAYEPIKNAQGTIIGIWYVGVPNTPYDQMVADFRNIIIICSLIAIIIIIIISRVAANYIANPLLHLKTTAYQVAQGDLREFQIANETQDEVGQLAISIKEMVSKLRLLIKEINQNVMFVTDSSEKLSAKASETSTITNEINSAAQVVAASTEKQMSSSEESSQALEEISKNIQHIAETSSVVTKASLEMAAKAEQGNSSIQQAVKQMDSIGNAVNNSASLVNLLGQRSKEIGQIVEVITGIASQTNLLALNAAIEAARAGEQGRGFAVVAEEVRKLAEQSEESARKISTLILEIQVDTGKAVEAMDKGTEEVQSGITAVQEAGGTFKTILTDAQNVAELIQEVSAAALEISAVSEEITATVEDMASVAKISFSDSKNMSVITNNQLSSMQEVSKGADTLTSLAKELKLQIDKFKF